ncbi:Mrp/NBP35 family ATP-binding protein [Croceimicrobium hydrocarbonivorans]|uniref:Iron-sulfur cluster carrier protein n=1 Tax=Croceimicrobium hydrocarbonivorans TaxID=2761580 RepID=A0A7H0VAA1_9FLAO|nr:Mrp/NBP35 family ATP-binding protein [Croceimicrobium hydrocarbonivorans]QNR22649.1 Mrp/NBP35 family ATP-binding protein [Croceimicrobium hydrocarbonivorans]
MAYSKSEINEALKNIPATKGGTNLVDAGHVKNLQIFGDEVIVDVISESPALHVKKKLEVDILKVIHEQVDKKLKITVNIEVPKAAEERAQLIRGEALPGVKNIIAVASGKGGVGKSTVASNLAISLKQMGFSVGLVDADIYGPSVPTMFDITNARPGTINVNGQSKMDPVEAYGIKILSIGFFAKPDQAVVWRGPMASKALNQLLRDAHWGELDFMILDLPPGTGDIHLSTVQAVPITGAVIVSTPQNVALADARKGVAMFRVENINVPVLGLIENMAYFTPPELPENKYYIFGQDGVKNLSNQLQVPFLGELPIVQSIREAGDVGRPAAMQEGSEVQKAFENIARRTVEELLRRNEELPPTEVTRITTMAGCSAV